MLMQFAYVSSAAHMFTKEELVALLEHARRENLARGITGMLLYKDGCFIQVIEGPEEAIKQLRSNLMGDERHKGVITLLFEEIEQREFPDWSMGFRDLSGIDVEGYSPFLNLDPKDNDVNYGKRAMTLLKTFRDSSH